MHNVFYYYIHYEANIGNTCMDDGQEVDLSNIEGFEWDEGNLNKNRLKHGVDTVECEEIFYNEPRVITFDESHSQKEERYAMLGKTIDGKKLTVIFTLRNNKIRIISARAQSKKERVIYEEESRKSKNNIKENHMEKNKKELKPIPHFKNEDEEAEFWLTHDTTEYFGYTKRVELNFPNLKPSTQSVTVRLPKPLIRNLKLLANEQDVPYQSLLKIFLDEKVKEKFALKKRASSEPLVH